MDATTSARHRRCILAMSELQQGYILGFCALSEWLVLQACILEYPEYRVHSTLLPCWSDITAPDSQSFYFKSCSSLLAVWCCSIIMYEIITVVLYGRGLEIETLAEVRAMWRCSQSFYANFTIA